VEAQSNFKGSWDVCDVVSRVCISVWEGVVTGWQALTGWCFGTEEQDSNRKLAGHASIGIDESSTSMMEEV
jgi:hypothetical protein